MDAAVLADMIAGFHLMIVLFALIGQLLVMLGGVLRWAWVRNLWFRIAHIGLIVFVAVQGAFGRICPLTIWEQDLRRQANQQQLEGTFVGRLMADLLYVDVPQETLNMYYIIFAVLVIGTWIFVRPRRKRPANPAAGEGAT